MLKSFMQQPFFITKKDSKLIILKTPYKKIRLNKFNIKKSFEIAQKEMDFGSYVVPALHYELGETFLPLKETTFYKGQLLFFKDYQIIKNLDDSYFAITNFKLEMKYKEYERLFGKVMYEIKEGNTYQINLTTFLHFNFYGNPLGFFKYILEKQATPYNSLLFDGRSFILSASPELFFEIRGNKIKTKPMKGTAPLSEDKDFLANDEKNMAENVMIVDLLRNDLGMICDDVEVPKLFEVEKYKSLYQMTSTVTGKLKTDSFYEIIKALFPCGSITGAPKINSMKIIKRLEKRRRGIYTGAIGLISKENVQMSIPIRTIEITKKQVCMGVGSGLTIYSDCKKEFREIILKTNFLRRDNLFYLFETLFWDGRQFVYLKEHLNRLKKSAQKYAIPFDKRLILNKLYQSVCDNVIKKKVSLRLYANLKVEVVVNDFTTWQIGAVKLQKVESNSFASDKTSNRITIDLSQCMEVIFITSKNELLEGSISNIFLKIDDKYYTPPIKSGLLPGVMRAIFIKENKARERRLFIDDLKKCKELVFTNSVRGIIKLDDLSIIEGLQ